MRGMYKVKIKDLPKEQKPREKLIKYGVGLLKNYELFSIILGKGTKKEDVFAIATKTIEEYGSKAIVNETDVKKMPSNI